MWLRLADNEPPLVEVDLHGDPTGRAVVDLLVDSGFVAEPARRHLRIARTGVPSTRNGRCRSWGSATATSSRGGPRRQHLPCPARNWSSAWVPPPGSPAVGRRLTVGREAELRLDDQGLSREHVRFTVDGDGVLAQDLGSLNKTYLFGQPWTPRPRFRSTPRSRRRRRSCGVRPQTPRPAPELPMRGGVALFSRRSVRRPPSRGVRHRIPAPPGPQPARRIPLVLAVVPLVAAACWRRRRHVGRTDRRRRRRRRRARLDLGVPAHRRGRAPRARRRLPVVTAGGTDRPPTGPARRGRPAVGRGPRPGGGAAPHRRPGARPLGATTGDPDHLVVRVGWTDLPSAAGYELAPGGPRRTARTSPARWRRTSSSGVHR